MSGSNHHFSGTQTRKSKLLRWRGVDQQPWLTSRRRYSFCSWESRLRMTPAAARVRTPTQTLVCRAGSDHMSWNWMWLRPSKENSAATCQSKTQKACLINSAVVWEIHEDIAARTYCSAKGLYVSWGYHRAAATGPSGTQNFSRCPIWDVHFVRLKTLNFTEV